MGISAALGPDALFPGLVLVKSQTIGSGVSSVPVTGVFSGTYDNYKIIVTGGSGSANGDIKLQLGNTTSGYYHSLIFAGYASGSAVTGYSNTNQSSFIYAGSTRTNGLSMDIELRNPYASDETWCFSPYVGISTGSGGGIFTAFLNDTNSYTDFTLLPSTGTFTGGTIRVYGYRN